MKENDQKWLEKLDNQIAELEKKLEIKLSELANLAVGGENVSATVRADRVLMRYSTMIDDIRSAKSQLDAVQHQRDSFVRHLKISGRWNNV